MTTLHLIAIYDGWIFSATGKTATKRNGTARRLTDLHYDQWTWLMPVYGRVVVQFAGDKRLIAIHSAVALGDIEMVGELCGKLIQNYTYAENQNNALREPWPDGLLQIKRPQNYLPDNNLPAV